MMKRLPNWERKLEDAIAEAGAQPFVWGRFDCALWVCDAVLAMTGIDLAKEFRGKYGTGKMACMAIRQFCGGTLADLADKIAKSVDAPEILPAMASRGDVVLANEGKYDSLAIVGLDARFALGAAEGGLIQVPRAIWKRAWRVG
jgi:hypothetical protein